MDSDNHIEKSGMYERAVQWVTEQVKPYLHKVTGQFVKKSIAENAKGNDTYARMIEFEVRRRGDGAGLTQDVAEPLVWIGVKSALAVGLEVAMHPFKNLDKPQWKWIGHATALSIVAQQGIELVRLIPRYKAGLQGSLEMAKDRWKTLEETGVDPFNHQASDIQSSDFLSTEEQAEPSVKKIFTDTIGQRAISADAILRSKENASELNC